MFGIRRVNVPIMLLSFVLSVLLWMHVKDVTATDAPQVGNSTFTLVLELRNQPPGTVVVGEVPSTVTFTAAGSQEEQDKINPTYLKAFIDLAEKPRDGRYLVRLESTSDYDVQWRPANLRIPVVLDQQVTQRINVEVEAIGDFTLKNYRYDGATSDPATITITGASSLVSKVKRARAYLNLSALETAENNQRAKVELLDSKDSPVSGLSLSTETVTVRAYIAPRPPRRSLLIQPVWNGAPEFGATVTDYAFSPAQVSVEGPADVLANLSVISTKPINIEGLTATTDVEVELDLPAGIRLARPEKIVVKVFIKASGPPPPSTTGQ